MTSSLPRFVCDLLATCPSAGNGVNNWLFRCARVLHAYRSEADIKQLLAAASAHCGRSVTENEINRAVMNSRDCAYNPGVFSTELVIHRKWPGPELDQIENIVRNGIKLVDLWEHSPVQLIENKVHTEQIIDVLFPGDPLLCVGQSNHEFDTCSREEWRGRLGTMPLIVPSPMSARTGTTQDSKKSKHTLANTGPRRFLVVECDFAKLARDGKTPTSFAPLIEKLGSERIDTLDMGAAVLAHLACQAPLALAVYSGGKSIHGWFYCAGRDEGLLEKFMRNAVRIGADRATWTRSQFVRMPDGKRQDGNRQAVYYFNPEVVK